MQVQADKAAHLGVSATLVLILSTVIPLWMCALLVFIIGVVKELLDATVDWNDVKFNIVGIAIAWLCLWRIT